MCKESSKVLECAANCEEATSKVVADLTKKNTEFINGLKAEQIIHFKEQSDVMVQLALDSKQIIKEFKEDAMSIIKWFCAIVGGVAVIASGIVGYTWITVQQKADLKDVLTLKEAKAIRELGDAYYMSIFVRKDNALVDSTTYYWHMKSVFGGALRGSGSIANDPYKVENNKN